MRQVANRENSNLPQEQYIYLKSGIFNGAIITSLLSVLIKAFKNEAKCALNLAFDAGKVKYAYRN